MHAFGGDDGGDRAARRACHGFEHVGRSARPALSLELHGVDDLLHRSLSSVMVCRAWRVSDCESLKRQIAASVLLCLAREKIRNLIFNWSDRILVQILPIALQNAIVRAARA